MLPHAMAMANKDIRGPILKDNSNEKYCRKYKKLGYLHIYTG